MNEFVETLLELTRTSRRRRTTSSSSAAVATARRRRTTRHPPRHHQRRRHRGRLHRLWNPVATPPSANYGIPESIRLQPRVELYRTLEDDRLLDRARQQGLDPMAHTETGMR